MARLAKKPRRLRNGPWDGLSKGATDRTESGRRQHRVALSAEAGSAGPPRREEDRPRPAPQSGPARPLVLRAVGSAESLGRRLRGACGTAMAPLRDCKVRAGRKGAAQRRSRAEPRGRCAAAGGRAAVPAVPAGPAAAGRVGGEGEQVSASATAGEGARAWELRRLRLGGAREAGPGAVRPRPGSSREALFGELRSPWGSDGGLSAARFRLGEAR